MTAIEETAETETIAIESVPAPGSLPGPVASAKLQETGRPRKSLATKQALWAVWTALLIGGLISVVELTWLALRERSKVHDQLYELVALSEGSAATAAWNLDQELAERVVDGLMQINAVRSAEIITDAGLPLAERTRDRPSGAWMRWVADGVFEDVASVSKPLTTPLALHRQDVVGRMSISIETAVVADGFVAVAQTTLIGGLMRNLLLGVALAWVFHLLLTRSLVRLGRAIAEIDPEDPLRRPLDVDRKHRDDELGVLSVHINRALERLDRAQNVLRRLATRDSVTGLANRTMILDRLATVADLSRHFDFEAAVLFLDLDRFKLINDSLGHGAGDLLLRAVADRLRTLVRAGDTVGRLGGDEFVIILEQLRSSSEAAITAGRILNGLSEPHDIEGHRVQVSASVGIALCPADGSDANVLLERADVAMYAAKSAGPGQFRFYAPELTERAMRRLRLEADLRRATEVGNFELHFQPKVSLGDRVVRGSEALIRWRQDGRLVPPLDFIPLAEETGLIVPIGDWVVEEACRCLARWAGLEEGRHVGSIHVSVNVSPRQLSDPKFPERLAAILSRCGVAPHLLELEITETVLMRNIEFGRSRLQELREIGVRIAIDDFGTGYSSLAYLHRLPINVLKIDRSFVSGLPERPAIAATVITLAQRLELETVAEGVETEPQESWLAEAGCTMMQGYLIAKPLLAQDMERWIVRGRA